MEITLTGDIEKALVAEAKERGTYSELFDILQL
jgi:hypothetical protein